MNGKTICLNMIVKNEAHVIKQTLQNICSYIKITDYIISDTGSTDGTESVITNFFDEVGIKGMIFRDEWLDFGHNRTLALKHGNKHSKSDFLFIFDADDMIYGKMDFHTEFNRNAKDAYYMKFGSGLVYKRVLLVNNKLQWKFEGVLHEYIVCVTNNYGLNDVGLIDGDYFVDSGKTGARSKDPDKYVKDAAILEKAFYKEAGSDLAIRYAFYCAQSYRDAGLREKSIEWYKKRTDLKGWNQEVYYSYYMIGQKYNELGEMEKAIFYWSLGMEADKERLECIYEIISYFRKNQKYAMAYGYFKMFLFLKGGSEDDWWNVDLNDKLFSVRVIYLYLLKYEMTIIFFYVGEFAMGLRYYKDLFRIAREHKCFGLDIGLTLLRNFQFYLNCDLNHLKESYLELNELYMNYVKEIYLTFGNRFADDDIKIIEKCVGKLTTFYHYNDRLTDIKNMLRGAQEGGRGGEVMRGNRGVFLTITSCKRYDLFCKTVDSFLLCCKDIDTITGFLCVDDNSSAEDRRQMLEKYPFFKFYFKKEAERGHLNSMNIIWQKVRESGAKYWIHLEDDWLFIKPEYYVARSVAFLDKWEHDGIHQVLFNKCYGETIGCYNLAGGVGIGDEKREVDYLLHVKDQEGLEGLNSAYWPHYSFRPSMCRAAAIIGLGDYNSPNTFFELDFANKYSGAGFKSAYFNEICCLHIGRLTRDRNNTGHQKNAYELNAIKQFNEGDRDIVDLDVNRNEYIKIVDGYLFIEGYDFFGADIEYLNMKMSLGEMIKKANEISGCVAFNTLGYFKNHFAMNHLITNDFLKGVEPNGMKRGIYVKIDKLIDEENRFYKIRGINTLDVEFAEEDRDGYIARTSNGFYKKTIDFRGENLVKISDIYDFWIEVDIVKYSNLIKN